MAFVAARPKIVSCGALLRASLLIFACICFAVLWLQIFWPRLAEVGKIAHAQGWGNMFVCEDIRAKPRKIDDLHTSIRTYR